MTNGIGGRSTTTTHLGQEVLDQFEERVELVVLDPMAGVVDHRMPCVRELGNEWLDVSLIVGVRHQGTEPETFDYEIGRSDDARLRLAGRRA